jgi:hypothetical protein
MEAARGACFTAHNNGARGTQHAGAIPNDAVLVMRLSCTSTFIYHDRSHGAPSPTSKLFAVIW